MEQAIMERLSKSIRDVPDFPKKGIVFKDITTLLQDRELFKQAFDIWAQRYRDEKIDVIAAIESRGFIFGGALAYLLGCSFCPVRKKGKLPYKTRSMTYELEYGTDTVEMHEDAFPSGSRVLLIDDLLATGGTASATAKLIESLGGTVVETAFLIELSFLKGREKLDGYQVHSLIQYG